MKQENNNKKIKKLSKKNYLTELSNSIKPRYKNGKIFNNNNLKFQLKLTKKNLNIYKKSIKNESYKSKLFNDLINLNNCNDHNNNNTDIKDKIKINIPNIKNDKILKLTLNDLKINNNFKSDLNSYDNKLLNILIENENSSIENSNIVNNNNNDLIHKSINELSGFKFINIKDEIKNLNFNNFKNKININNFKIKNNSDSDNSGVINSLLNSDDIVLKLDDLTIIKSFD
ncbi:unnamed protein product [[Candida] boidinii]|uniref:Unnamed protein product n=1 Tax=Candida boidinii TaxID=5477 RepID=A0ACB5TIR5_CANBO|nr:unnamed protein product [[Candida] boidinii]